MIGTLGVNATVTITRLSKPAGTNNDQKSWTTDVAYTGLSVYIERASDQQDALMGVDGSAKGYRMFSSNATIKEADKVTDNFGRTFVVKGVRDFYENTDVPNHSEAFMVMRYPNS